MGSMDKSCHIMPCQRTQHLAAQSERWWNAHLICWRMALHLIPSSVHTKKLQPWHGVTFGAMALSRPSKMKFWPQKWTRKDIKKQKLDHTHCNPAVSCPYSLLGMTPSPSNVREDGQVICLWSIYMDNWMSPLVAYPMLWPHQSPSWTWCRGTLNSGWLFGYLFFSWHITQPHQPAMSTHCQNPTAIASIW